MASSPRPSSPGVAIADVEAALARLLDPSTPSSEQQQLHAQLAQLKATPSACLPVLFELLASSRSEYALWFAASALEEYVATGWARLGRAQQLQVRQLVWRLVLAGGGGSVQVAFVLRKLRKVLADIARVSWKEETAADASQDGSARWPEFLSQVEALVVDEQTREAGLELLAVVAEEFGRDDALALADVKMQARTRLAAQLPGLLALLANVLHASCQGMRTQPLQEQLAQLDRVAQIALTALNHLAAWAPVAEHMTENWISLLFELASVWEVVSSRGAVTGPTMCASSVTALQCLTELMSKRFLPTAVNQIVARVLYCLLPLLEKTVEDGVIGRATEEYLDKLSEFVEAFLTQHLKRLENPSYMSVLPTFLQAVLTLTSKQPHIEGFLNCLNVWEVFVGYIEETEQDEGATNEQTRAVLTAYEKGLVAVMLHLVDRVSYAKNKDQLEELNEDDDGGDNSSDGPEEGEGMTPVDMDQDTGTSYGTGSLQDLAQLVTDIARGNNPSSGAKMVELSERKQFTVDCIALIRRIASFPSCAPPLLEIMGPRVHDVVHSMLFRMHEIPHFSPHSEPWEQQRCAIRDLTANCAILSSVCAQYYSSSDDMNLQMAGWQILTMFIKVAEYLVQHRLHTRGDVFVELECEVLTCIRFCLSCISFVIRSGAHQEVLQATESVVQVLLQTLDTTIVPSPQVVMQNSMQLLANLGFVLSYEDMVQVPSMTQLEAHIHSFSQHLPLAIQGDLYTSMSNSILNSAISMKSGGNSAAEQAEATKRWTDAYGALILPIRESIDQSALTLHQNDHRVLERVMMTQLQRDCYLVRCLARSVETKPKVAKDAFFSVYQASFPSLIALLTSYFTTIRKTAAVVADGSVAVNPTAKGQVKSALKVVNEIVRLYAQLLKSIRREMQKDTVAEIMRTFVEIFNDAQLSAVYVLFLLHLFECFLTILCYFRSLNTQGNAGVVVLCGFLQLLRIVVEEPTTVFSSFVQNILDLCFGPLKEVQFRSFHQYSFFRTLAY